MSDSTPLAMAVHAMTRRHFFGASAGAGAVALAGGAAVASVPSVEREARRLLAAWREADAAVARQDAAIDALIDDARARGVDHYDVLGRAEDVLDDLVDRRHEAVERIAALACRATGRPPLPPGAALAVVIDGHLFFLEHYNHFVQCDRPLYPADVVQIGGAR